MTGDVADQRSAIIAKVYAAWAAEQGDVEPVAAVEAEGAVAMNAGPEADADLDRRIAAALAAAGVPFEGGPA